MTIKRLTRSSIVDSYGYRSMLAGNTPTVYAYDSIATMAPLTSATANYTFNSIPQTYKHLQIRGIVRVAQATTFATVKYQFNGDTGGNYTAHLIQGDGGTANSDWEGASTTQPYGILGVGTSYNSSIFGVFVLDILDYTNTNKYKTARLLSGADVNGAGYSRLTSGVWMNSSAITSLTLGGYNTGTIDVGTTFALYGIK